MDKYELKYWWEENRRNFLAGTGLLAGIALMGVGILMLTKDYFYDHTAMPDVLLAEHLIVHNDKGELDLYSIEDEKRMDSLELPENFIVAANQDLDITYVYDKDEGLLNRVDISKDKLSYKALHEFDEGYANALSKTLALQTTDENFAFHGEDGFVVVNDQGVTEYDVKEDVDVWNLSDAGLYYAVDDSLSFIDFAEDKIETIEIGAPTSHIHPNGLSMMVHNTFGEGMGESILLRLPQKGLFIEEMKNVESIFYTKPRVPGDENQLIYLDIERNDEGNALRKQLLVRNAVTVEDESNEVLSIELTGNGNFIEAHTLASNGYLYNYEEGEFIGVSEIRNGRQYKTIEVTNMNKEQPYFLPVYGK